MSQTILIEKPGKQLLAINIPTVDQVFPGFRPGDFAIIHGSTSANFVASHICIQAQKTLDTNIISIEGTDSINQECINRLAKIEDIEVNQASTRVYRFKAFSAYQMTSIILERLNRAVEKYDAKLVLIPDIAGLFLSEGIAEEEATRVLSQITAYLQSLARRKQIIIVTTHIRRCSSSGNRNLEATMCKKANIVIAISETPYDRSLALEKHPYFLLGEAEFPRNGYSLTSFF